MASYFIRINQKIRLDQKTAKERLTGISDPSFSVQLNFAVQSGSVGFEITSSSFVEGGLHVTSEKGVFIVHLDGLAKVKLFEIQEAQLTGKTPLYIYGITLDGTYELIAASPIPGSLSVQHNNEIFPTAVVEIGKKKAALSKYPRRLKKMLSDMRLKNVKELFFKYEDSLAKSGLLLQFIPEYVGVQLDPQFYTAGAKIFLKCNIGIEVLDAAELHESLREDIADAVWDWLKSNQIELDLQRIGVAPELFDWLTVSQIKV